MLCGLVRYSHIYEARMNPALNGISVIRCFECDDVIEICDGIILGFYTGLSHICGSAGEKSKNIPLHIYDRITVFEAL